MSRFLTPGRCADCGAPAAGQSRCPSCGLLQVGRVADDLRATLHHADQILDVLRRVPTPAPAPPAPTPPTPPTPPTRRGLPSVSVPLVLLGLGTVCVLVAAVVFVAVTWTDLSLAWRTTILLALTGVGTAAAVWAVRRGLRGAAEALTLVAGGLLLIDLVAGNSAGLPLLSGLQGTAFWWLVALTMLAVGLAWALWARRTPTRTLLGQQVVAVLATTGAVWLAVIGWDYAWEWLGAVVTVVAAVPALVLWRLRVRVVAAATGVLGLLGWLALALLGLGRAVAADGPRELYAGLDAAPLLVASALVAVPACVRGLHRALRAVAAVPAVAGPVLVALLPARELAVTPAVLVVAAAAAALALAALAVVEPWRRAVQVTALTAASLPAYAVLAGAGTAAVRVTESAADYWSRALTDPLGPLPAALPAALPGQPWALVLLGGLVGAAGSAVLTPRLGVVLGCTGAGLGAGALVALLLTGWSLLLLGGLVAVAAGGCVAAGARTRARRWPLTAAGLVAVGTAVALPSAAATAVFLVVHAGLVLGAAAGVRHAPARAAAGGIAAALLAGSVQAGGDLAQAAPETRGMGLLVFACAVAGVAQWLARHPGGAAWRPGLEVVAAPMTLLALAQTAGDEVWRTLALGLAAAATAGVAVASRDRRLLACVAAVLLAGTVHQALALAGAAGEWRAVGATAVACLTALAAQAVARAGAGRGLRAGLEATAGAVALLSLAATVGESLALAVGLTLAGVAAVVVSFVSADRRRVAWLGSVLLVLASWVRLVALDVDVVEAYTLPGSAALLVAGLVWMRRTPAASSWQALGAPLTLGLGPSLAVALQQPTSLRALLVGVAALGLVGAAVRLGWGAPLVVGGIAVATLALVNVAPYAAALPRWVLFGAAGVALLGLGVTWERRRQDLATVHRYATRLR